MHAVKIILAVQILFCVLNLRVCALRPKLAYSFLTFFLVYLKKFQVANKMVTSVFNLRAMRF